MNVGLPIECFVPLWAFRAPPFRERGHWGANIKDLLSGETKENPEAMKETMDDLAGLFEKTGVHYYEKGVGRIEKDIGFGGFATVSSFAWKQVRQSSTESRFYGGRFQSSFVSWFAFPRKAAGPPQLLVKWRFLIFWQRYKNVKRRRVCLGSASGGTEARLRFPRRFLL